MQRTLPGELGLGLAVAAAGGSYLLAARHLGFFDSFFAPRTVPVNLSPQPSDAA